MKEISCIVIVGKPGAGKSSIGSAVAKLLEGTYISLGGFMREILQIPDPHIGVDKNVVYDQLIKHLENGGMSRTLVLDCHPYPENDLEALRSFLRKPPLKLLAVIHIETDDEVALNRLRRRPRPGQTDEERIKYFNDHVRFIDQLMNHPSAIHIQNNIEFDDVKKLDEIAVTIFSRLLK